VASSGSPVISNDVLINGLDGFDYIQSFEATGTTPFVWTGPGAQCPAGVGAVVPGAFPTGTSTTFTTTADVGTLTVSPTTAAGTFTFGVCVEGAGATFAMKNFTMVINDDIVAVANSGSDNLTALTFPPIGVIDTIAVGATPRDVAFHPNGTRAYVVNQNSDDITVIDTADGSIVATIASVGNPLGIAITPDGTRGYFTDNSGDRVGIIDTDPTSGTVNTEVGSVDLSGSGSSGPLRVAITPDGSQVYVTNTSQDISVIETAGNTVTDTIDIFPATAEGVAVSPTGQFAYAAHRSGFLVSVIDTGTNTETTTITVQNNPQRVAFTPDGTLAFVTNLGSESVSVIDTSTHTVSTTIALTSTVDPTGVAVTPDGLSAYVAGEATNDVQLIDVTGPAESGAAFPLPGATAPDGVASISYPVLHFTISALPDATDETAYATWVGAMGGTGTLTWSVVGDGGNDADCADFETGLDTATGVISVTPNFPNPSLPVICQFDFTVTDSATVPQSITQTLMITTN
jgi:YVTN family beta-propeller protein